MEPMLRQNRDLVTVEIPSSRLKKFDVALYKHGEKYVLHRVIDVTDTYYRIRGDNTYAIEQVPFNRVIGVLTSFQRKGITYKTTDQGYLRYVRFWNAIYPLRAVWFRTVSLMKKAARKLGIMPLLKKLFRRH